MYTTKDLPDGRIAVLDHGFREATVNTEEEAQIVIDKCEVRGQIEHLARELRDEIITLADNVNIPAEEALDLVRDQLYVKRS